MQSRYEASFDREMGCTEREWLMWLPGAVRGHELTLGVGRAHVAIAGGGLALTWRVLGPRRIALMSMPRLAVQFRFEAVGEAERHGFMRYFDLFMQRGGG